MKTKEEFLESIGRYDFRDSSGHPLATCEEFQKFVDDAIAQVHYKNNAYSERNKLVALIASLFPAELWRHEGGNWEEDWRWIVAITLPAGQVTWHIHDSELALFEWLPRGENQWDGHTTEEKYERVLSQIRANQPFQGWGQ